MEMSQNAKRCVVNIIVFLSVFVFGEVILMAAEPNENITQRSVESFLKQLAERKITRVEVYYMNLNTLTRFSITEDFLRDSHYDYKVIAMNPRLSEVEKTLREFKFERIDWPSFDFRWGCVFYVENEEIFRLFFPNAPVVAVDGIGYKATPELIKSLMQFLPVEAYKEMDDAIARYWGVIFSKQQDTPHEQKESDKP